MRTYLKLLIVFQNLTNSETSFLFSVWSLEFPSTNSGSWSSSDSTRNRPVHDALQRQRRFWRSEKVRNHSEKSDVWRSEFWPTNEMRFQSVGQFRFVLHGSLGFLQAQNGCLVWLLRSSSWQNILKAFNVTSK